MAEDKLLQGTQDYLNYIDRLDPEQAKEHAARLRAAKDDRSIAAEMDRMAGLLRGQDTRISSSSPNKDVIESRSIEIPGVFKRKDQEPSPADFPSDRPELSSAFQIAVDAQRTGDFDVANAALESALKQQEALLSFRKDLTPEAVQSDIIRGFSERFQGQRPSMQMTNTGVFEGERRSPFDLSRFAEAQKQEDFGTFQNEKRAQRSQDLAFKRFKLDSKNSASRITGVIDSLKRLDNKVRLRQSQQERQEIIDKAQALRKNLTNEVKQTLGMIELFESSSGLSKKDGKFLESLQKRLEKQILQADKINQKLLEKGL